VELYADRKRPHNIAAEFASLRDMPLVRMHELQVTWAFEQARGLAKWARDNPTETDINPDDVDGTWPLRPYQEES
jgi:hypothetical protein